MGDIMGDLNSRRGMISGMTERNGARIVTAKVPLSEMFGLLNWPKIKISGRATYSMEFLNMYKFKNVEKAIIEERSK